MEVDDVEVHPKQRVIRVTVDVVTSRWRLTLFPPNVGRSFRVLSGMSMRLTTLPLDFGLWDTSCSEKSSKNKPTKDDSAIALCSAIQSSDGQASDPHVDMSKIATSSKVKLENMPLLFASVETSSNSFNGVNHVKCKEPEARCIRKTRFSSPPRPVKQSKIDDNLFLTSNRQSPDLIRSDADYPRLAVAYSPIQGADTLFPETKRFSPTPDLAVNNRWLKISRTPDHIIYNEPTTAEDNNTDYSSLCMGYPPSENTENSLLEIDFAEADPSLNWAPVTLTPETHSPDSADETVHSSGPC
ncbi:hypothetical protein JOM56_008112 [Amanita muscaria]